MYPVHPSPNNVLKSSSSTSGRPNYHRPRFQGAYNQPRGNGFRQPGPQSQAPFYRPRRHFAPSYRPNSPNTFTPTRIRPPNNGRYGGSSSRYPRTDHPNFSQQSYSVRPNHFQPPVSAPPFATSPVPRCSSGPRLYKVQDKRRDDIRFNSKPRNQQFYQGALLYIIRGAPGSGKSTLAKHLKGRNGVILSTDDYFMTPRGYFFEPSKLPEAHDWNQSNAEDCLRKGRSPVIIDNTNLVSWEMKPYMLMALDYGYKIEIVEPNTPWKSNATELSKRNLHRVSKEKIEKMLEKYERNVTVESVLGRSLYRQYEDRCLYSSSTNPAAEQNCDLNSMMRSMSLSGGRGQPASSARAHPSSSSSSRRNYYS